MRLLIIFLLSVHVSVAQFTYVLHQDVPVVVGSDTLQLPWAGGINSAQVNTIDLNDDGKTDLVVFDRMGDRVIPFLNVNNTYVYAPEYQNFFPEETEGFMLLRDFDCDGRKDLFTKDLLGIRVFKNTTVPGQPLSWEPLQFYTGFPGPKSNVILTKGFSGKINLQLQADDLPALLDADGDGDLDVLNVKFVGTSTIEFHKNFSMERYGTCDSLDLERVTQYWGEVEDCACGEFAFGTSCLPGGRTQHAGGKGLLALDLDNDQDLDILYSDSECAQVYQLTNTGTNENPLITQAVPFPAEAPIAMLTFPSVYYEDVDFDGVPDMLASPNLFTREFLQTNFQESLWFYKNTGSSQLPAFTFQSRNFLQGEMIDVGDNAVPAFADADDDGDLELFIGTFINGISSSIYLYENTGTRSEPAFHLITDDYLSLSFSGFTNIKPQFFDMNGDGRTDLVFTASNPFGVGTNLYYIPNTANNGLNFSGQSIISLDFFIFSGENITVSRINNDMLPDLLVGRVNGAVEYWQNTGTPSSPSFTLSDPSYLGLDASVLRQNPAIAIGDLDADGNADLILGDQTGVLNVVSNFKNAVDASGAIQNLIYNPITESYSSQNLGSRLWPTIANLLNTNKPTLVVGNLLGGLHVLKHDESSPLPKTPQIDIFPNPVSSNNTSTLNIRIDRPATGYIISITGQEIEGPFEFQPQETVQYSIGHLSPGLYIFRFITGGETYSRKFIVY